LPALSTAYKVIDILPVFCLGNFAANVPLLETFIFATTFDPIEITIVAFASAIPFF
jgi:hypothetical protein